MGSSARRPARFDDLLKVPETKVAEIIDGELIVSPRRAFPHARAASMIGADLIATFDGPPGAPSAPGGWWFLAEPELHFGDDVVVPDQVGWRRARIARLPNVAAYTKPPDWACEVVSPATGRIDRSRKMRIYAREGVGYLWLVDPLARTIEVYRLDESRWLVVGVHADEERARVEPFEEIELDIGRWWIEGS